MTLIGPEGSVPLSAEDDDQGEKIPETADKAWVAGVVGVVLAALWVYQPVVSSGEVPDWGTHLNALIAALVSFGALFGSTYQKANRPKV